MGDFEKEKKDYISKGGVGCLFCGAHDMEGGFVQTDTGSAWQKVGCNECGAGWTDIYKLADVDNIEPGTKENAMTKIVVFMDGGLVQTVMTDNRADVTIIDHDIDGLEPKEIKMIEGKETYIYRFDTYEYDPVRVNNILNEIDKIWSDEKEK